MEAWIDGQNEMDGDIVDIEINTQIEESKYWPRMYNV